MNISMMDEDSNICVSEEDVVNIQPGLGPPPVWTGPPQDASFSGVDPHPYQPGLVYPGRYHCPFQFQTTQFQPTYPNYFLEPPSSQYHLVHGALSSQEDCSLGFCSPGPGPADGLASGPWLNSDPILCSLMPGELHVPPASVCGLQDLDQHQFQGGLTEFTSHIGQPGELHVPPASVCGLQDVDQHQFQGGLTEFTSHIGQPGELHVPPASVCGLQDLDQHQFQDGLTEFTSHIGPPVMCSEDPGPEFLTLTPAPPHRDEGSGVTVSGTTSQPPQYEQAACPVYKCSDEPVPLAQVTETVSDSKSRKPCHCTRSQCLKLYCECFSNGVMCNNCNCSNCHNNTKHQLQRYKAMKSCLGRNPEAFRSKIVGGSGEARAWRNKGCTCKRTSCLKNYCECYEANIMCTSRCKCVDCRNYNSEREDDDMEEHRGSVGGSVISRAVVESVCGSLLATAVQAEQEEQSVAQTECRILEEFGLCLTQISQTMFKHTHTGSEKEPLHH